MKKLSLLCLLLVSIVLVSCGSSSETTVPAVNTLIERPDPFAVEGTGEAGIYEVTSEKIAYNPLTGKNDLAEDRVGMRPIAVSVNNISVAWPQYGTSHADYILEIETEGGITRLMSLFSDTREVEKIGSVRSLRDQFIEALFPLDPIIVHIGTSIYADKAVLQYNFSTLDGGNYPSAIWTDRDRYASGYAIEHTKFTGGSAIEKGIAAAKISTKARATVAAFNFIGPEDPKIIPGTGDASRVTYNFSSYYDGDFRYNADSQTYLKWQFGKAQMDAGANVQLAFDNLFLLFADIQPIPGTVLVHVDYSKGGEGYYFSQGRYEKITWQKPDYPSNFTFLKEDGSELQVNVGKTHMGVVDVDRADSLSITA